jgi:hypothetical protein
MFKANEPTVNTERSTCPLLPVASDDSFFKLNRLKSMNDTDIAVDSTNHDQKQLRISQKSYQEIVDQQIEHHNTKIAIAPQNT